MKLRIINTGEELGKKGRRGRVSYRLIAVLLPQGKTYKRKETPVRNPKIGAHVNAMHQKWLDARGRSA